MPKTRRNDNSKFQSKKEASTKKKLSDHVNDMFFNGTK